MSETGTAGPRRASADAGSTAVSYAAWWIVFAVALIARLAIVRSVPPVILWPDGREFEEVARSLYAHGTYGLQTLRPPGYPTFIAGVYALFGPHLVALRVVEAVIAAAGVALVGVVGARVFGPLAGWLAAALMAVHPVLAFLPSTQYSESLLVLVLVLGFAVVYAARQRSGLGLWIVAGALFGGMALIRPNAVLILPGLAIALFFTLRAERRRWLAPGLAAAASVILTVTPWIVRCHRVTGMWYLVATGGGRQIYLGNNERATGATNWVMPFTPAEHETLNSLPNDMARERWLYRQSLDFMRREPGRAARLYLIKLGNIFSLWPETSTQRLLSPWNRLAQALASVVVFAGALLALVRLRDSPALWPLAGAAASFVLCQAVYHSVMRYRMAIEPCLLWMAGAGWASLPWVQDLARRARIVGPA